MSKIKTSFDIKFIKSEIIAGVVVAALSIPVAMGYAQIAGLPPVYGLYSSLIPILAYIIFSSSKQLIFGIDATSAAITASLITAVGLTLGGTESMPFIAGLSFSTGIFLCLFSLLKLGKLANYVPTPVMSGFIAALSLTVMFSQIPKIMGISSAGSEFDEVVHAIITNYPETNFVSVSIGLVAILLIFVAKKYAPKLPMPLVILIGSTILGAMFKIDLWGVKVTGDIPTGLPKISFDFLRNIENIGFLVVGGAVCALLIATDSLLTSKIFAVKNNYDIDENKELLAFGMANFAGALIGCVPSSASLSRTAASEQFKGKTKLVSVVAAVVIALVVLYLGKFLYYMPQPALAGIVFAALLGVVITEVKEFLIFLNESKIEFIAWIITAIIVIAAGVLKGIIVGVIITIIVSVILRISTTSAALLGKITGKSGFYDIKRHPKAIELPKTIIYRFSESLYFLNISTFIEDIERKIDKQTEYLIIDAHAMTQIDISSATKLKIFLHSLKQRNIKYVFADTIGDFRDIVERRQLQKIIAPENYSKTIEDALAYFEINGGKEE